jgi:SAM-dependent methyltransferase
VPRIDTTTDAFGQEMWAHLTGGHPDEIVERDDGFVTSHGIAPYFADFDSWPARQRKAIRALRGDRVLDVGCGAGRVALHLHSKGFAVTAIDNSPLAIAVAKRRGVKDARVMAFEQIRTLPSNRFDGVVMFGNNFGLFGGYAKAKRLLKQLHRITRPGAVILAESLNPYGSPLAAHTRYRRRNRLRGRMAGQIRIRVRFRDIKGPWFDYLLVSPGEMRDILKGTGWRVRRTWRDGGPLYVAQIVKE